MITTTLTNGTPMTLRGFATQRIVNLIIPQDTLTEEDRGFVAGCCYVNLTLAGGTGAHQNDVSSFLYKRYDSTHTIDFDLEKEAGGTYASVALLVDDTYGTFYDFGDNRFKGNDNLKGYKIKWASVLSSFGEGNYRIKIDRVLYTSDTLYTNNYNLRNYSVDLADNTIWIEWTQNGQIIDGIDYTGIDWYNAMRVPGFFGNEQLKFEEEEWKDSNYANWQIRNELIPNYKCEIAVIPCCIGREFRNLLQANITKITDYNIKNFCYNFIRRSVRLKDIGETKYNTTRQAVYNLTFSDRTENHIKINC